MKPLLQNSHLLFFSQHCHSAATAFGQKCLANFSPRGLKSINPSSPLELMQRPLQALYSD